MSKTGKITHVDNHVREFTNNTGRLMFVHLVTFANGEQWNFNAYTDKFKHGVGEEITYDIRDEQFKNAYIVSDFVPKKQFTPKAQNTYKANVSKDESRQISIERQSMLKAAVDFCSNKTDKPQDVIEVAEIFLNFVQNG